MGIQFTTNQVITMAPDASSATAGKKLAQSKHWQHTGQNADALWGECQGSALYQVRIALSTMTMQCSCPSRKQPCKHALALLLLAVTTPAAVPEAEPPDWIVAWLTKRAATTKRKETAEPAKPDIIPSTSTGKSAEKRLTQVNRGIERLDLWLNDLVRNGLGSLETQSALYWEQQAAQMVDAQAPGLATYMRRLADIPNATPDWTEKLLAQLGKLALLTQAFHKIDQLDAALQDDIRQLIGWNLKEEEVMLQGEHVSDDWLVVGQVSEELERGRSQRTWLIGTTSQRSALVLQFAFAGATFTHNYPLGSCQHAELIFWPGAQPQRALIAARGALQTWTTRLPATTSIEGFLDGVATSLARLPWRERFLCLLRDATLLYEPASDHWYARDENGQALPLVKGEHWQCLALSGGLAVDFVAEWNGETLLPLGMLAQNTYYAIQEGQA